AFFDATIERLGTVPLIGLRDPAIDGLQRILKRVMDIALSALMLVLLAPLMGLLAILIKAEDGGPVIYRAPRVGENGHVFEMLKLRSMVVHADRLLARASGDERALFFKHEDDPRITRTGRWMRRWNMDELPQFWNVLRGDMSLVGPRPELPFLTAQYADWQHKRFAVPQGMTGWWQINGREESPLQYLHTDQDLYYVQNYSLWLDIQILWKTVAVVLRGKGAV
ncbi:MAG: sugar transferase, partial [Caldilineaceae bacterium]